ncbi:hypothetical protein PIB30_078213 [Stylosanthes scabra]|uniref:Uncharacterized protein n=1 Tax=Stylosanthes scabra TaxID=79078 RepID=A0ABU6RRY1_9FABA|nr:hypothetical protein [Stylosanthes scabra]
MASCETEREDPKNKDRVIRPKLRQATSSLTGTKVPPRAHISVSPNKSNHHGSRGTPILVNGHKRRRPSSLQNSPTSPTVVEVLPPPTNAKQAPPRDNGSSATCTWPR